MFVSFTGSLLANLNHNNLKYGTEISRTPSFMQGAMTPLTASPNKNLGPEKIILLVCNRACTGQQGKRYYNKMHSVMQLVSHVLVNNKDQGIIVTQLQLVYGSSTI